MQHMQEQYQSHTEKEAWGASLCASYLLIGSIEPLLGSHGRNVPSRVGIQVTMEI